MNRRHDRSNEIHRPRDNQEDLMTISEAETTWVAHRLMILRGLERIEKELGNINQKIDEQDSHWNREIADLRVEIGMLKVKMAIISVIAAAVTSSIVGTVVSLLIRGH